MALKGAARPVGAAEGAAVERHAEDELRGRDGAVGGRGVVFYGGEGAEGGGEGVGWGGVEVRGVGGMG